MRPLTRFLIYSCALLSLAAQTQAKQAQFYRKSGKYGFAITSAPADGGVDFLMQISAAESYGWAAVGTGNKMDNSLMFIIYPSGQDDNVTFSVRTTNGHDTPNPVSGVNATLLNSEVENGRMTATIQWHQGLGNNFSRIDVASTKQAWIWALGPNNKQVGDSGSVGAEIEQHSHYGVFFVNMAATQNSIVSIPSISGTSSVSAKGQPGYYNAVVYTHAILLGVAFVVVFPFGVIGLRWKWRIAFKVHWILQVIATTAAYIGLAVAVTLSVTGIEYSGFDQGHQILGLIVISLLSLQVLLGYLHHQRFKKVGHRTVPSYLHVGLGRVIIYAGMANAILGALLSEDTGIAIAVGAASAVLGAVLEYMAFRHRRQYSKVHEASSKSSSSIALNNME